MPDPNKLAALAAVGYEIRPGCGSCKFGLFEESDGWGKCMLTVYEHAKHTGVKWVSVHEAGWCSRVEMRPRVERELTLSGFMRFVPSAAGRADASSGDRTSSSADGREEGR